MTETTFAPQTIQQAAAVTGLAVDQIGIVRMQLDALLKEGILIDLNITGESMFVRSADWSEIGINPDDIRASRLTKGAKYLIPEQQYKRLKSVSSRMRQRLEEMSRDITGFRPYRYLNYKAYDKWIEAWGKLLADFDDVKTDILSSYDESYVQLHDDFLEIAAASWKAIKANGYDVAIMDGVPYDDFEKFSGVLVTRALSKFPTREQIEDNLKADYRVSIAYGREQIAQADANAIIIRAQAEDEANRIKAQKHAEYMQDALLQEQFRHDREVNQIEEQERWTKINAMMHAEAEHIRAQFAETVSPIEEAFAQVRQEMAQICADAADSIAKSGFVRGKTAEKLRGLVEFYQLTSIQDDATLLKKLQDLRTAIGAVGDERTSNTPERSTGEVVTALNGIIDLTKTIKEDLAIEPSRFAFLG